MRLVAAAALAGVAALPVHWESLRYPELRQLQQHGLRSRARRSTGRLFVRTVYYNVEILALPHRWFNDYRSLANVWLPALVVVALLPGRSRAGFYAWAAVVDAGAAAPQHAGGRARCSIGSSTCCRCSRRRRSPGFVLRCAGTRTLALALAGRAIAPVRRRPRSRRSVTCPSCARSIRRSSIGLPRADGNMVLVEISPHRDMDSDPNRRTPTTPFDVHFEGLLPGVAGQRFYSQMIDGWVWNVFRGQVVGAGTFAGRAIAETPLDAFVAEMRRWGVRHCSSGPTRRATIWRRSGRFVETLARAAAGRTSSCRTPTRRSVVTTTGSGQLRNLDFLGADVDLVDVTGGRTGGRARELLPGLAGVRGRTCSFPCTSGRADCVSRAKGRQSTTFGWSIRVTDGWRSSR